jgi:BirA family biotin operon repressor/biotin-[acetyl-CoA-carboxylase] ligase
MSSYQNPPFHFLHLKVTGSTNDDALELASKTAPSDGFCVFTDFQTGGKGQYGRKWQSEAGKNLLASYIFQTAFLKIEEIFSLHLMASLAVYHHLKLQGVEGLKIKWPNDLLASGRKIAGILIQNSMRANSLVHTVVGIGINLNQERFSDDIEAVSVKMLTGKDSDPGAQAESLYYQLMQRFELIRSGKGMDMLPEYNDLLSGAGCLAECESSDGKIFKALVKWVDREGKIWLEHEGKIMDYSFGALRIRPADQGHPERPE